MTTQLFNANQLKKELKIDAKALNIPPGAAQIFIDKVLAGTDKALKSKKIITEDDLTRIVVKELKKYHADLAYVYKNRDKIV